MALLVVPLLLAAFVISSAATAAGFQATLHHVDHLLAESLTKTELLLHAVKRANLRAQLLNSVQTDIQEDGAGEYLMHFSIGTPKPSNVTAIMETGSSFIWTQCQPCKSCSNQSTPVFKPKKSKSFSRLTKEQCKNYLADSKSSSKSNCTYSITYGDGSRTRGVLATDTFTFDGPGRVPGIVFGCGFSNNVSLGNASGIVGLGPKGLSLVSQLNESRFSYCFPEFGSRKTGVLTIGSRATNPTGAKLTPIIKNPTNTEYYYLSLKGISIGTKRLPIDSTTFEMKKNGSGGMIIDCGTAVTYLVRSAYDQVEKELTSRIRQPKYAYPSDYGFDVCYNMASWDNSTFPVMVFHFQNGVDLRLTYENYLVIDIGGTACLTMLPVGNSYFSLLGNFQLRNTLVTHDLAKGTLSFLPNYAKCSGN